MPVARFDGNVTIFTDALTLYCATSLPSIVYNVKVPATGASMVSEPDVGLGNTFNTPVCAASLTTGPSGLAGTTVIARVREQPPQYAEFV